MLSFSYLMSWYKYKTESFIISVFVGVFYLIVLMALRDYIGKVFTNEA